MKTRLIFLLLIWGLIGLSNSIYAAELSDNSLKSSFSNYRLGVGDKVKIQVYGEEDLTIETTLTDAGTITYPILGELMASGMTIGELNSEIVNGLKGRYLVEPKVTIYITEYRDFYINGEVEKPGAYPYEPGLTVNKAVSIAGGFTQRASRTSITIVSDKDPSQIQENIQINSPINPGDVITVEESFF
jgi:polysaccharide biosynthesis/export protein VpsN